MSYILLHVLAYNLKDKSSACCCHYDPSHLLMLSNTRPARKGETDKELLLWGWKTVNYRCCRKKRIKKKTELNGEVKIIEGRVKTWIPLWAEMQKKKKTTKHTFHLFNRMEKDSCLSLKISLTIAILYSCLGWHAFYWTFVEMKKWNRKCCTNSNNEVI